MKGSFQLKPFRSVVAVPLCLAACVFSHDMAMAQFGVATLQARCSGASGPCPAAAVIGVQESLEVVKNQPYEAQALTEIKQTLADGSHIDQTTTATIARDSNGRTVRTQKLGNDRTFTIIFDPVAKTSTKYDSDAKIAHVIPLPVPTTLPSGATAAIGGGFSSGAIGGPVGAGAAFSLQGHTISSQTSNEPNAATESLGTKTIDGIEVVGTRNTNTIPAGAVGNEKELTITREAWYSPELKVVIQSMQSDPRLGQTTYSLSNIQRSEPEAALFQVPPDYKVEIAAMLQPPR